MDNGGLTGQEEAVMNALIRAWNQFLELEQSHPDDLVDFKDAIHEAQRILAMRVVRRDHPDYWNISGFKFSYVG